MTRKEIAMFIKLTRLDNSPIWINASFVVTVEPRKGGGSIVVPIGDGLDYDVRETPERVLEMLGGAPSPTVVPVPAPKGLAPTPEDVSPESEPQREPDSASDSLSAAPLSPDETETDEKPTKKRSAKKTAEKKPRVPRKAKKVEPTLPPDQIERLKKMAPGSMKKLQNTLVTQFGIADAASEIAALETAGVLSIDRDHIIWK